MAWPSLQDISRGTDGWGQFAYLVKSDVPTIQITWPAGPQVTSASPPSDGAMPIRAGELAALVAARIGLPNRIRAGGWAIRDRAYTAGRWARHTGHLGLGRLWREWRSSAVEHDHIAGAADEGISSRRQHAVEYAPVGVAGD